MPGKKKKAAKSKAAAAKPAQPSKPSTSSSMAAGPSSFWDPKNLAHRYTVSFFASQYGDDPLFVTATSEHKNRELLYFNIAAPNNDTNATICAGLMVTYMQAQGLPYHAGKTRDECFATLTEHLKDGNAKVLLTADIVDDFFMFLGEM